MSLPRNSPCRECGQLFVIFLDSDQSSLKARIWLDTKLNDEHDAERDQHDDCSSVSNSQFRAIAEVYACNDSKEAFAKHFVAARNKVKNLERFDLA